MNLLPFVLGVKGVLDKAADFCFFIMYFLRFVVSFEVIGRENKKIP